MNRGSIILVAAGVLGLLTWRTSAWLRARAQASDTRHALDLATSQAQEILALRAQSPTAGLGKKPDEDVLKLVTGVLRETAISESKLRGVSGEGESVLPPDPAMPQVKRRRTGARLNLEPMSLAELGTLLSRWRQSQGVWSVRQIELTHLGDAKTLTSDYRVNLSLSAVYVEDDAPRPAPPAPALSGTPKPTPASTRSPATGTSRIAESLPQPTPPKPDAK